VPRRLLARGRVIMAVAAVVFTGCSGSGNGAATRGGTTSSTSAKTARTTSTDGASSRTTSLPGSGIQGSVIVDDCISGAACSARPPAPLRAAVDVLQRVSGSVVASSRVAGTGAYRVAVTPGEYRVRVRPDDRSVQCPQERTSVSSGSYSTVIVHCTATS
jgi:hypothetical protein